MNCHLTFLMHGEKRVLSCPIYACLITCNNSSSLFLYIDVVCHCMYMLQFFFSLLPICLDSFHLRTIIKTDIINMFIIMSFSWCIHFFLLKLCLRMKLLSHKVLTYLGSEDAIKEMFQNNCTNLHSHQKCMRVSVSLHLQPTWNYQSSQLFC